MHADQISIPEPCHEDWGAMRPEDRGRFCEACTKHVHDLSSMTHDEAQTLLSTGADLCVRFARQADGQLVHRPTVASRGHERRVGGWLRRAATAMVGATMMTSPAMAGHTLPETEEPSWFRQVLERAVDWLEGEAVSVVVGEVAYVPPPPPPPEPPLMGAPVPDPPPLIGKVLRVEPSPDEVAEPPESPRLPASDDWIPELSE